MILVQFDFWYGKVANEKLENDSLVTSGEKEKERGGYDFDLESQTTEIVF